MLLIALIAGMAGLPADPPGLISLSPGVVRLPELVADLSKKSGEPLGTAFNLRNEVLYLNLKPKSLKETMKLIAEVSGCEWIRRDKRVELTRTSSKLSEDEQTDREADLKLMQAEVNQIPKVDESVTLEEIKKAHDEYNRSGARLSPAPGKQIFPKFLPGGRFSSRVLRESGIQWILSAPYGQHTAFGTRATRIVHKLPFSIDAAFRKYLPEREAVASISPSNERGIPVDAVFVVNRMFPGVIHLLIYMVDAQGVQVDRGGAMFTMRETPSAHPFASLVDPAASYPKSKEALAIGRRFFRPKEDRALLDVIRNPVANEPLELLAEAPLNALFKGLKKEAIFSMPDSLSELMGNSDPALQGSYLLSTLNTHIASKVVGNCLVGRPRRPSFAWQTRADRWAMRDLIAKTPLGTLPSLDELGEYAVKQNELAALMPLERPWLALGAAADITSAVHLDLDLRYGRRDAVMLWGSLSTTQRDSVRKGNPVPVSNLSSPARDALNALYYERETPFTLSSERYITFSKYPNGLPNNAILRGSSESEPYVQVNTPDGYVKIMPARSAGRVSFLQKAGNAPTERSTDVPMRGALLRAAEMVRLNPRLELGPKIKVPLSLQDFRFDPSSPKYTPEKLPGEAGEVFRKEKEDGKRWSRG